METLRVFIDLSTGVSIKLFLKKNAKVNATDLAEEERGVDAHKRLGEGGGRARGGLHTTVKLKWRMNYVEVLFE